MYKECEDGYEHNRKNIADFSSAMRVDPETKYGGRFYAIDGRRFGCAESVSIPGFESWMDYPEDCRYSKPSNGNPNANPPIPNANERCQDCCNRVPGCRVGDGFL